MAFRFNKFHKDEGIDSDALALDYLKLDQTTPQTTVGRFTFPEVVATTYLTSPLLIGGSAVGSKITYKSTTGAGTTTGIAHQWLGGTNGGTVIATMLNNGNIGIGTTTPTYKLDVRGTATTDSIRSAIGFDIYPVPNPTALTGVAVAGAGLEIGDYYYLITYTTALGETNSFLSNKITTTAGNQSITLTIPVSTDARVTGRKIYRSKVNSFGYLDYLLATVANNSDTTYTDTTPDASLTGAVGASYFRMNTTSNQITVGGVRSMIIDTNNTSFGYLAGGSITTGGRSTLFGYGAGRILTTGSSMAYFGDRAGWNTTTGAHNVAINYQALFSNTTGSYNIGIGTNSLLNNATGSNDIAIGFYTLAGVSGNNHSNNVAVGNYSGYLITTGQYNTFLAHQAGYNITTGSYNLYSGYNAGRFIADGTTANQTSSFGVYLGNETKASANGVNNEIVIGYNAIGNGSNTFTFGNSSITKHIFGAGNVGIGTTNPQYKLHIMAAAGGREVLLKGQVSDAGNDAFIISNGTGAVGTLAPSFNGYQGTNNAKFAFQINAAIPASVDASNSYNAGLVRISAYRTDSATDPTNGNLTEVVNRNRFSVGGATDDGSKEYFLIDAAGKIGVGTVFPLSKLHISTTTNTTISGSLTSFVPTNSVLMTDNASSGYFTVVASNTADNRAITSFVRSRGTLASPTILQNNDQIGDLLFGGYDGSVVRFSAGVFAYVDGVPTSGNNVPIRLSFVTGTRADNRAERVKVKADGNVQIGSATNYANISPTGRLSYVGSARKQWTKYTANTVTLTNGTSANTVADLRTMTDGLYYSVQEAASTPGIDLIVDFVSVTAFEKCRVLAQYEGSDTHAVALQLYNWTTATWDTFNSLENGVADITTAGGVILHNYEFTCYDDTNYIGTGADLGKVRVRLYHTMAGNASHDLHIDEVSLRQ